MRLPELIPILFMLKSPRIDFSVVASPAPHSRRFTSGAAEEMPLTEQSPTWVYIGHLLCKPSCHLPVFDRSGGLFIGSSAISPPSGPTSGMKCQQPPSGQHQIGQTKQGEQLAPCSSPAPGIGPCDAGTGSSPHGRGVPPWRGCSPWPVRSIPAFLPRGLRQGAALARLHGDMPGHRQVQVLFPLFHPLVARVAEGVGFIPMQQSAPG